MSEEPPVSNFPTPQYRTLPYGEQQGSFRGVAAGSNRDDGFFSGENNYVNHVVFTGFRYQCVEYARRFLLLTTGCIFDACGRASEIYRKTELTHVETGKKYPFLAHDNGKSTQKPQAGDIIIWPYDNDGICPWGHVGVISYVTDDKIGVAEQNQYFGSFVSPCPDYLDGERCVGRFLDLEQHAETGAWTVKESGAMPSPLGWMSYPDAPTRERIHETLNPLPEYVATRSTALDDPAHPFLFVLRLPEPIEIPCGGRLTCAYGLVRGTGESAVGAGTATSRVIRFTLQFLFRREHIGAAFLSLPSNPLNATIAPCPALDALFSVYEKELGTETCNEAKGLPALSKYFGLPEKWLAAMQKEFAKGELHMFADSSFAFRCVKDDAEAALAVRGENEQQAGDLEGEMLVHERGPRRIRVLNPHDEAWQLAKMNFGTCKMMVEVPQLASVLPAVHTNAEFQLPGYRCFGKPGYSYDFGNYLKDVEERRGPRTAFTIVLSEHPSEMDGDMRELVTTVQSYCEKIKYPVRVISESDLFYDAATGKLHARISDASPPVSSPNAIAPKGDFEVNFVFALAEWVDILQRAPERHKALYDAAIDYEKSDVVFAKPLWSYLASGLVHRTPEDAASAARRCDADHHAGEPLSIKFYDIVRRLFEYALPRQAAETWDQEVSEFKDSCRRLGLSEAVPTVPEAGFIGNCAIVNFAMSAFMAHTGGAFTEDPLNKQEDVGHPAAIFHVFSTEND